MEKFCNFNDQDLVSYLKSLETEVKNWRRSRSRKYRFAKNFLKVALYLNDPDDYLELKKLISEGFPRINSAKIYYLGKYCSVDSYLEYLES